VSAIEGFNGVVALTCSGAPATTTCGISPAALPPSGSANYAFSVTVSNTANAMSAPLTDMRRVPPMPRMVLSAAFAILLLGLLAVKLRDSQKRMRWVLTPATAVLLLGVFYGSGCGGGPGGPPPPPPPTNAVLTITGTSSAVNRTVNLNLTIDH
jgi:hypothetical protein